MTTDDMKCRLCSKVVVPHSHASVTFLMFSKKNKDRSYGYIHVCPVCTMRVVSEKLIHLIKNFGDESPLFNPHLEYEIARSWLNGFVKEAIRTCMKFSEPGCDCCCIAEQVIAQRLGLAPKLVV